MKIAIVCDYLNKFGGAERVVKKLTEMFPEADLYTLLYDEEKMAKFFPIEKVNSSFLQRFPKFLRKRYQVLVSLMPYAIESFDLMKYDLVISSSNSFAHGVLTGSSALHVSYCHSPMRYIWDYSHKYLKEKKISGIKAWWAKRVFSYLRVWDRVAADRADFYIANSEFVKKRIKKYFNKESAVVYPPVNIEFFEQSELKTIRDHFLVVSTITEYKKIDVIVSLFNKIGRKLIIVGDGQYRDSLERLAGENVKFVGKKSDLELRELMSGAKALIQMNEEDFGMATVEALACGIPVVAFNSGGVKEIVKDGHNGVLFNEQSIASLDSAIAKLILNEDKFKADILRESARKFSENQFEKNFLRVLNQALEDQKNKFSS